MKLDDILPKLSPAEKAWLTIGPQKYGWTINDLCQKLLEKTGQDVDPLSVEEYLRRKGLPVLSAMNASDPYASPSGTVSQFSGAMERDIELALVSQLDSFGLRLFVDSNERNGRQYPAGEFGRIDLLTTDSNGDFVVIELKRDDVPRAVIGQIAGYIAFVKNHLAEARNHSVSGWILARPSSPADDRVLEEAANAVGILVKWYWIRVELLENRIS